MQTFEGGLHGDGRETRRLTEGETLHALVGELRDELTRAVLGLGGHGDGLVVGVEQRTDGARGPALHEESVELAMNGQGVGNRFLGLAVVPATDDLHDVVLLSRSLHDLPEPHVTIAIHGVALQAAHFEHFSFAAQLLVQELAPLLAHGQLVLVDLHDLVGVEHVVERHDDDALSVGQADHAVEAFRAHGQRHDAVEALVDEVLHRAELRGDVGSGGDDLELLDERSDRGIYLDAPRVAHVPIDQRDAKRRLSCLPLEVFGVLAPGCETLR